MYQFTKYGWDIFHCLSCGVSFVFPQPTIDDILKLYDASYFQRGNKYSFHQETNSIDPNRKNDLEKILFLKQYRSTGKLLDVGCALGGFLEVAKAYGYNVSGIEVAKSAASHVKNQLNIDVINLPLPNAKLPSAHYDVVTMWDVIEHLQDPISNLEEIHRILKPCGILAISTGNSGSTWARMTGKYWHLLTPPQHLFYFSRNGLEKLLIQCGFSIKTTHCFGKYATIDFLLFKSEETFGRIIRPAKMLAKLFCILEKQFCINLYDIMTVVAVKK